MPANKAGRYSRQPLGLADLKRLSKEASKTAEAARKKAAATANIRSDPHRQSSQAPGNTAAPLSADDIQLFRRAMKTVAPIKDTRRAVLRLPPIASTEQLRQRRTRAIGDEPARLVQTSDHYSPARIDGDDTRYLRAGHGPDVLKSLANGKWPADASIDLHGNTLEQARERLERFLQTCVDHQVKCVRVIHGKGHGSKAGTPVLKQTVRRWLGQLEAVIAYVECKEHDGGAGAVQVLLQVSSGGRHDG